MNHREPDPDTNITISPATPGTVPSLKAETELSAVRIMKGK